VTLLLDTTVLLDVLRARQNRRSLLADVVAAGHLLATSAINIGEVYAGMRRSEEDRTETFLSSLVCYPIDGRDRTSSRLPKKRMGAKRPHTIPGGHDGRCDRP
jgi:predicted nucleic acid-binding protein